MQQVKTKFDIFELSKDEWLADLLEDHREQAMRYWRDFIREYGGPHYEAWSEDELIENLLATYNLMLGVARAGDIDVANEYIRSLITDRLQQGFLLEEIELGVLGLQKAVLQVVEEATEDPAMQLRAFRTVSYLHDLAILQVAGVYQELQLEQQARFNALYDLGTHLTKTLELDVVLNTAVRRVAEIMRVSSSAIVFGGDEGRSATVQVSYRMSSGLAQIVPDLCHALLCGPERVTTLEARESVCAVSDIRASKSLETWSNLLISEGCFSMVCVPMISAERVVGSLLIFAPDVHDFTPFEVDFLLAISSCIATAVSNARLFEEARGKRELDHLLEAAKLFTSTLDLGELLRRVARLAVESVGADYSGVLLPDEVQDQLQILAYYARPGGAEEAMKRIIQVFGRTGFGPGRGAVGRVFESGEPLLINDYAGFPDRIPSLAEVTGSMMAVPMKVKGRVLGVFNLVSMQTGAFANEDLSLAMGIADLAAVAIENARLYERQRNIAETFQRSFLPAELPVVPGLELAIRYRAALMEAEVGGDFYDAFRLDDDKVGILVADVSGKGLSAAVYTAMGKYMIRAYSMENLSPSLVLEKFNKAFAKHAPSGMFVTMFYAVLDGGTHTLTFSNAGQEQPMFYSKRLGALDKLEVSGPGLGAALEAGYAERTIVLEPGDMGLVYTDGATDVRRGGEFFGFERLESLFRANLDGSADEAAEAMLRAVFEYGEGRLSDDVAILVLKRPQ